MKLSVLLFRECEQWVAQCLEYDIVAQAETIDDVVYEFQRLLVGYVALRLQRNLPPLELDLPPAPGVYWRRYGQASRAPAGMRSSVNQWEIHR